MFTRIRVCLLWVLISAPGLSGTDFAMKVTDKNYLDTQGFSVFLYDSTYHPVFVGQKNTAMEMILHGQRIATNGAARRTGSVFRTSEVSSGLDQPFCRFGSVDHESS